MMLSGVFGESGVLTRVSVSVSRRDHRLTLGHGLRRNCRLLLGLPDTFGHPRGFQNRQSLRFFCDPARHCGHHLARGEAHRLGDQPVARA